MKFPYNRYEELRRLEHALFEAVESEDLEKQWHIERRAEEINRELEDFFNDPITQSISL